MWVAPIWYRTFFSPDRFYIKVNDMYAKGGDKSVNRIDRVNYSSSTRFLGWKTTGNVLKKTRTSERLNHAKRSGYMACLTSVSLIWVSLGVTCLLSDRWKRLDQNTYGWTNEYSKWPTLRGTVGHVLLILRCRAKLETCILKITFGPPMRLCIRFSQSTYIYDQLQKWPAMSYVIQKEFTRILMIVFRF
jgi:hypothetical protein